MVRGFYTEIQISRKKTKPRKVMARALGPWKVLEIRGPGDEWEEIKYVQDKDKGRAELFRWSHAAERSPYQPCSDKNLLICYSIPLSDTSNTYLLCHLPVEIGRTGPLEGNLKEISWNSHRQQKSVENPKETAQRIGELRKLAQMKW